MASRIIKSVLYEFITPPPPPWGILCVGEKYCNFPLTTTRGDRFASCENIVSVVSRSQTSSLPRLSLVHSRVIPNPSVRL